MPGPAGSHFLGSAALQAVSECFFASRLVFSDNFPHNFMLPIKWGRLGCCQIVVSGEESVILHPFLSETLKADKFKFCNEFDR